MAGQPPDVTTNAQTDAAKVIAQDKRGDHDGAFRTMQDQIKAEQKLLQDSGESPAQVSADMQKYFSNLADQYKNAGVLPDLSLELAKNSGDAFKDGNGNITPDSIKAYESHQTDPLTGESSLNPLTKALADQLTDQNLFHQASEAVGGVNLPVVGNLFGGDSYDASAIDKYFQAENSTRDNRNNLAPLFQGNPPLIQVLDTSNDSVNHYDGNVSSSDMQAYLDRYNQLTNNGSGPDVGPYSKANADFVTKLMNGDITYEDPGDNGSKHDLKGGFNVGDLEKYMGLGNQGVDNGSQGVSEYQQIAKNFNDVHQGDTIDTTPPPPDVTPRPAAPASPAKPDQTADGKFLDALDPIKNPDVFKQYVTPGADGQPVITSQNVAAMLADPKFASQTDVINQFKTLYGDGNGGISLNKVAQDAGSLGDTKNGGAGAFEQYLARSGDAPVSDADMALLKQQLSDPSFVKQIVGSDGKISKDQLASLAQRFMDSNPNGGFTADQAKVIGLLNNSFNVLAKNGEIDPQAITGKPPEQQPAPQPDKPPTIEDLPKDVRDKIDSIGAYRDGEGPYDPIARLVGNRLTPQEILAVAVAIRDSGKMVAVSGKPVLTDDTLAIALETQPKLYEILGIPKPTNA
jgi:hypothetical protein